jgi:NifU-like protein involved in Fe-S cluster formation
MKLQIKINPETQIIEDAKFKTFGCGSAIASSSIATEWLKGRSVDDALAIKNHCHRTGTESPSGKNSLFGSRLKTRSKRQCVNYQQKKANEEPKAEEAAVNA